MSILKIVIYSTKNGREPFYTWLNKLDIKTRAIIRTRLDRVRLGNLGDTKRIKNGGDKKSQNRDITKAVSYWLECKDLKDE